MRINLRTKRTLRITALLLLLILLAACGQTAPAPAATPAPEASTETATESTEETATNSESLFPLTITDALGQEFTFDAPPKIGCWWSGCAEILADLGVAEHAGSLAVEGDAESPFFYPVGRPTHIITDSSNPEDWAAAEVDIVIMRVPDADWLNAVKEVAPIFFLHHPSYGESSQTGYEAYRENLRIVAQLVGKPEAAEIAIEQFNNTLANLKQISTPETTELVTAFIWEGDAYRAIDGTNPLCQIITEVGLGSCLDTPMWEEINPEAFLAADPDVIVFMNNGSREYTERTDPIWSQLAAVTEERVYSGIGYYYCCGTRTMIYSLQEYAHFLLPDVVPDPGPMADFVVEESPLTQPVGTSEDSATEAVTSDAFPVTIEHKFGSITIESEPQRVMALGYSEVDPILAVGVKPIAVRYWFGNHPYAVWPWAQDELGDATPEVLNMPFGELNYELITSLQPDLIVATHAGITPEEYEILAQIAPTLAQSGDYVDYGMPWQEQTKSIGRALGREELAIQKVEAVEQKITDAAAAHPEFAGTTFAWASASDPGTYWITNPDMPPMRFLARLGFGFSPEMTEFIGTASSGLLSSERLDLIDGGVLLYQARTAEGVEEFNNNALLQALNVVKEGRTIVFDSTEVPAYGALSFSTVLSLEYAVDEFVPMLVDVVKGAE